MISKTTLTAALPSSAGRKLAVDYVPIDQLKLNPKNARVHSKQQIRQIAKSIESFGFNVPVLVGANLNVIAGHGRVLAAKHLGLTEVPTIRLDHLTGAQRRAFMIADYRFTAIAVWADQLLAEQLKELASVDLDFDIEATGFDLGEIDFRIESLLAPASEPTEPPIPVVSG